MSLHDDVLEMVAYVLNEPDQTADQRLYETLRLLAKYRSQLVADTLLHEGGTKVRSGPFEGLVLPEVSAEGCYVPKLLGTYEEDLHPILYALPGRRYDAVINVGCAEGYYAVGLARLLEGVEVHAYDTDPNARALCAVLAEQNGVASRIRIGETFSSGDFARYDGKRVCVICDIEGGEAALLDPALAPSLRGMDLLVEVHDVFVPECSATLRERFEGSHSIEPVVLGGRDPSRFPELAPLEHLDQLLAVWEWRLDGNDWLWMEAKSAGRPA